MSHLLHFNTSISAIDFADGMISDYLWTQGRGSKATLKNLARAKQICKISSKLDNERFRFKASDEVKAAIDVVMSALAHEISKIAKEAIADKSLKTKHFDPWVLTNVVDNDEDVRAELAGRSPLKLAA